MKLEFEKLMIPSLLIGKKQYVGKFVWPESKLLLKGIAAVRRDSCEMARTTLIILAAVQIWLDYKDFENKPQELRFDPNTQHYNGMMETERHCLEN
jgi:hypothetical protein